MIKPEDFGFERCSKDDLVGGDPDFNAKITQSILDGEKGPKRNAVVINSAAGLYVAGKVSSLKEGVVMAEELIDTGVAKKQLEQFIKLSNTLSAIFLVFVALFSNVFNVFSNKSKFG